MRTQDEEPPDTVLARMPGTVSIKGVAPMVSETLSGHGKPDGCLTVLWTRQTRGAYPAGQTGYSPPIPKAGIGGSPRFAAYFGTPPPHASPKTVKHPGSSSRGAAPPLPLIEAQGVIAVLYYPCPMQAAVGILQLEVDGVLRDGERRRPGAQQVQRARVFVCQTVGRIEEHDAERTALERDQHLACQDGGPAFQPERRQVLADGVQRPPVALQKPGVGGAAAQGLDAHRARPGIGVHEAGARDPRLQNVEQGLAHAVGGGARGIARNALQAARPELSRNDAHQPTVTRP